MTLQEFLAALAAVENGAELVKFFEGEQAVSKEEVAKRNRENQNLRARLKTAEESAAPLKEKVDAVLEKLGLDADSDQSAIDAAVEKLTATKGGDAATAALQKRLDRLERERKAEREKYEAETKAERAKRHDLARMKELQDALAANKATRPEQLAKLLMMQTKVLEDDSIVFVTDSGEEVKVSDGVKAYLDACPEFRVNDQLGGAGSGGGVGGGKKPDIGVDLAKSIAAEGAAADKSAAAAQSSFFKTT